MPHTVARVMECKTGLKHSAPRDMPMKDQNKLAEYASVRIPSLDQPSSMAKRGTEQNSVVVEPNLLLQSVYQAGRLHMKSCLFVLSKIMVVEN